jgi:hypothetical protein
MRRHTIDVDEQVFARLEAEASARLETHNTVLRRLVLVPDASAPSRSTSLPGRKISVAAPQPPMGLPQFPFGTPEALRQVLWVVHLVRTKGRARSEASAEIATVLNVATQTINDKYGRQLGITAGRFDEMLREPALAQLEARLGRRFPPQRALIEKFLSDLRK